MSDWTPGPWAAQSAAYPQCPWVRLNWHDEQGGVFTAVATVNAGLAEANANARLIAAAPELADALREIANWLEQPSGPDEAKCALSVARAALAKLEAGHE